MEEEGHATVYHKGHVQNVHSFNKIVHYIGCRLQLVCSVLYIARYVLNVVSVSDSGAKAAPKIKGCTEASVPTHREDTVTKQTTTKDQVHLIPPQAPSTHYCILHSRGRHPGDRK